MGTSPFSSWAGFGVQLTGATRRAGLRRALLRAGVVGDLHCWRSGREVLEQPLYAETWVREAWLQRAQCRLDMAKVAAGRPKLKLAEQAIQ